VVASLRAAKRAEERRFEPRSNPFPQFVPLIYVPADAGTEEEVVVIIAIGIAGGLVLLCTCMFVLRRKRAGRG
jgi:hypothetical protein